jgi:hypothetical protein
LIDSFIAAHNIFVQNFLKKKQVPANLQKSLVGLSTTLASHVTTSKQYWNLSETQCKKFIDEALNLAKTQAQKSSQLTSQKMSQDQLERAKTRS